LITSIRSIVLVVWAGLLLGVVGCTKEMFSKERVDQSVLRTESYRLPPRCERMELSSSTLTVTVLRQIVSCFNSNGSIADIQSLIADLSDEELRPWVDASNAALLEDHGKLYVVEKTYNDIRGRNLIQPIFQKLGALIENPDWMVSALSILDRNRDEPEFEDLLHISELLAADLRNQDWLNTVNTAKDLLGSSALSSLQSQLRGATPALGRSLADIVPGLLSYLNSIHTYKCSNDAHHPGTEIKSEFFQAVLENNGNALFGFFENTLGTDEASVRVKVPKLVSMMHEISHRNPGGESLWPHLASSFAHLNGPISCAGGARKIPSATIHFIRELSREVDEARDPAEFVLKTNVLNLIRLGSVCELPPGLDRAYAPLAGLAEKGAMGPMAGFLNQLYRADKLPWRGCDPDTAAISRGEYPLLTHFFVNLLGDTSGLPPAYPSSSRQAQGFEHLIPLLEALEARNAWSDLFLVSALPQEEARTRLRSSARFLVERKAEINQKRIFDVLVKVVSRASVSQLLSLARGVDHFINSDQPVIEPLLTALRSAYFVNDKHPFLDMIRDSSNRSLQNRALVDSLLKISGHRVQESRSRDRRAKFIAAIRQVSELARNGDLEALTTSSMSLFHRYAELGRGTQVVARTVEPPYRAARTHDLSSRDLSPARLVRVSASSSHPWYSPACRNLNVSFQLDRSSSPDYNAQFENFLGCQNVSESLARTFRFLKDERISSANDSPSLLSYGIQLSQRFLSADPTVGPFDGAIQGWLNGCRSDDFYVLLNTVEPLLSRVAPASDIGQSDRTPKPVVNAALRILGYLSRTLEESVRAFENSTARILRSFYHFTPLFDLLRDHWESPRLSPLSHVNLTYEQVEDAVRSFEAQCGIWPTDPTERNLRIQRRAIEIVTDATDSVTTWDGGYPRRPGYPHKGWKSNQVFALLEPIWKLVSKKYTLAAHHGNQIVESENYHVLNAQMGFMANHTAEELFDWFDKRSTDYRLISYLFPGETCPKLRLVNTLDRLELILQEVDLPKELQILTSNSILGPRNLAYVYLQNIAHAWGDVDPQHWPDEIKAIYRDGTRPPTLSQTIAGMLQADGAISNYPEAKFLDRPRFSSLVSLTAMFGLPKMPPALEGSLYNVSRSESSWEGSFAGFILGNTYGRVDSGLIVEYQRRLYNIWQVASAMEENTRNEPGATSGLFPGANRAGGMELLRDLFYHIHFSTPPRDRIATVGDANHLTYILGITKLGVMRQLSRVLTAYPASTPEQIAQKRDFFVSLFRIAQEPVAIDGMKMFQAISSDSDLASLVDDILLGLSGVGTSLPSAVQARVEQAIRSFLLFMDDRSESNPLRMRLARTLENHELSPFLKVAGDPEKVANFDQLLGGVTDSLRSSESSPGELEQFIKKFVIPSLEEQDDPRYSQ